MATPGAASNQFTSVGSCPSEGPIKHRIRRREATGKDGKKDILENDIRGFRRNAVPNTTGGVYQCGWGGSKIEVVVSEPRMGDSGRGGSGLEAEFLEYLVLMILIQSHSGISIHEVNHNCLVCFQQVRRVGQLDKTIYVS